MNFVNFAFQKIMHRIQKIYMFHILFLTLIHKILTLQNIAPIQEDINMKNLLMSRELTFKMRNSTLWAGRIMSMLVENFLKTICKFWEFLALML